MSIEITVKQKLFGSKNMPLDVILGENLSYGYWENDQLTEGKLGETEFIAYDPGAIGRGFSVIWNSQEKKSISLRLPQPTTTEELHSFYDCVTRMASYWGGALIADGNHMKPDVFLAGFEDMVSFNDKILAHIVQQILDGNNDNLTLYSAKWPLTIGKEEAELFAKDPAQFAPWLHEKQSMDVFFCNPRFFMGDQGVFGQFMLMNDLPTVFPQKPNVPFGMQDPATGKALECKDWRIILVIEGESDILREMDYDEFLRALAPDRKIRYDGNHFLVKEMSEAEVRALADM